MSPGRVEPKFHAYVIGNTKLACMMYGRATGEQNAEPYTGARFATLDCLSISIAGYEILVKLLRIP